MATPTNYNLKYPDPDSFCKSGPCGSGDCVDVMYYNVRPQTFCQDVTLNSNCSITGNLSVTPQQITVGGIVYTQTVILDALGRSFNVLASPASPIPFPVE